MRTSEIVYRCGRWAAYEYQGGIEVLVVLLDVVGIVLGCLPLVHCVEVYARIVGLDRLEEGSESILEAESVNGPRRKQCSASNLPLWIDLQRWRFLVALFVLFSALHESPHVLWRRRGTGRIRTLQTSRRWYRGGWRKGTYQRSRARGGVACARS